MERTRRGGVLVSVIIVNFNTSVLLKNCLNSLYKSCRNFCFEVIVVDNSSTDDSIEMLHNNFPAVKVVEAGENLGFGRANNLGAKHAIGKYLFLLNSDTIVHNDVLSIFYNYMELHQDEKIGALGCWLKDEENMLNVSFGFFPSIGSELRYTLEKIKEKTIGEKQLIVKTDSRDVDYVTGADLFLPSDVFMMMGGFDPAFFMYYEETDLQYRMMKDGYKRRIIDGPEITHLDGGSFENVGLTPKRIVMNRKSCNYYAQKNFKAVYWLFFRIFVIIGCVNMFLTLKHLTIGERWYCYKIVLLNRK